MTTMDILGSGEKKVYCRCWLSGSFPICDGTHMKHNTACSDNVGPLIVTIPKSSDKIPAEKMEALQNKADGRKKRVLWGYRATAIAYLFYCQRYFAAKAIRPFAVQVSSGYVLAAGLAYILASAVQGDRLASCTYKRLNLVLLEFGLVGILGWGLVKFGATVSEFSPLLVPPLLATINGIKGYGYGVLGWDKSGGASVLNDFNTGVQSTVKGYFSRPKNVMAVGYLAGTWMMTGMMFVKLVEIVQITASGASGLIISTRLSRFARYAMISAVLYTLKDAANRGRLDGTTFIELNFMASATLAALVTFSGVTSPLGGAAAVFSLFSVLNGAASLLKKRQS